MSRIVLALIFLVLWLSSLVNAAIVQLQAYATGGEAFMPAYYAKIALVLLFVAGTLLFDKESVPKRLLQIWVAYILAVAASFAFVVGFSLLPMDTAITYYMANNLFLLFLPAYYLCAKFLRGIEVDRAILLLVLPLSLLGLAQYLSDNPIVYTDTKEGFLAVQSWLFYGHVRGFSLFASGLDFSFFLALAAGITTVGILRGRVLHGLFCVALLGVVLVATYATFTRLAYIFVAQTIIFSAYFCVQKRHSRFMWALYPVLNLVVSLMAVVGLPLIMSGGVLRNDSLVMRIDYWQDAVNVITGNGPLVFLFGTGVTQAAANPGYIVDNMFLNFMVQTGFFGTVTVVLLLSCIWMSLRPGDGRPLGNYAVAVSAFWTTWMFSNFFNTVHLVYILSLMPVIAQVGMSFNDSPKPARKPEPVPLPHEA